MEGKPIQKVLVVDDDSVSRKKLCRILERLGFTQIEEAERGDDALTRIKDEQIDLVMADWYMPGMSGLDLLTALRVDEATKQTQVFIVTGEARQDHILTVIQAGANGYIMKPFSQENIRQQLEAFIHQGDENTEPEEGGIGQSPGAPIENTPTNPTHVG
ncbi:MAG: response regulator [Nitrospinae bacterium]|nr:response regulator [Nitrospinota bacterium]